MAQVLTSVRSRHRAFRTSSRVMRSTRAWIASSAEPMTCACTATWSRTTSSIALRGARVSRCCRRSRSAATFAQVVSITSGAYRRAVETCHVSAQRVSQRSWRAWTKMVGSHPSTVRREEALHDRSRADRLAGHRLRHAGRRRRRDRWAPCARSWDPTPTTSSTACGGRDGTRSTTRGRGRSGSRPSPTTHRDERWRDRGAARVRRGVDVPPRVGRLAPQAPRLGQGLGPGRGAGLRRRTRLRHARRRCATLGTTGRALVRRPIGGRDPVAKVTMPQLGESVAEGTIGRWLKQPGDTVAKYEPLVEVITDKVNAEVPSPFAGVLKEILAQEGDTVPNNAEIAIIETEDEALSGGTEAPAAPAPANGPAGSDERPVPSPSPPSRHRRPRPPRPDARHGPGTGPAAPSPAPALQAAAIAAPDPDRRRRPQRPHDPGRSTAAPRARARGVAGGRHGRRRADHPRGRHRRRRGPAHGDRGRRSGDIGRPPPPRPARPARPPRRPTPASRSRPARTRSSSR